MIQSGTPKQFPAPPLTTPFIDPQSGGVSRPWVEWFLTVLRMAQQGEDALTFAATIDDNSRGGEIEQALGIGLMSVFLQGSSPNLLAEFIALQSQLAVESGVNVRPTSDAAEILAIYGEQQRVGNRGALLYASATAFSALGSGTVTTPLSVLNGNINDAATLDLATDGVGADPEQAILTVKTFPNFVPASEGQSLTLNVTTALGANTITDFDTFCQYSLDSGSSWADIWRVNGTTRAKTTDTISLPITQNPFSVWVRAGATGTGSGTITAMQLAFYDTSITVTVN